MRRIHYDGKVAKLGDMHLETWRSEMLGKKHCHKGKKIRVLRYGIGHEGWEKTYTQTRRKKRRSIFSFLIGINNGMTKERYSTSSL